MRVLITGATGFIGSKLIDALSGRGDEVIALTRSPSSASSRALAEKKGVSVVALKGPPTLGELMEQVDAVVNLAGEPVIGKRWSPAQKQVLTESRIGITRAIFAAIASARRRPRVVVSASAIGYYGFHVDEELSEQDRAGNDFLAQLCKKWEAEALSPSIPDVRVVVPRIGVVLGREGGALEQMARPFRLFGGGPIGSGEQWVSWIHLDDTIGLILYALDHDHVSGVMNLTAPKPVTNKELSRLLGKVLHRPNWLPVPKFALKVAFGEVAQVLTTGQRVLPKAAQNFGYKFQHPEAEETLRSLLS